MKTASLITMLLVAVTVLSACSSEDQIRDIVKEEIREEGGVPAGETPAEFEARVEVALQNIVTRQQETARQEQEDANKPKEIEGIGADDDPFLGDADAPVTIVEFSDYGCPFCARHTKSTSPEIIKNYVETGKVKLVFRDFPIASLHPDAFGAAVAANCVREQQGDEAYFAYHDILFDNSNALGLSSLIKYAEQMDGLDQNAFAACAESDKYDDEINKDMADGRAAGVTGTPGFFVNDWFIKGAFPYSTFEEYIEIELNK